MDICEDLTVEYKDIFKDENPLYNIIKIIEERLNILGNKETISNPNTILIKSDNSLLNDKNANLSKSVEVPILQSNSNKNLSTENVK